jgi:hypothetical protein
MYVVKQTTKELEMFGIETQNPLHMSGRNQSVMEKLHNAIDALIAELGADEARTELQGIVDEWETARQLGGE